ncbi:MAG: thermonuclease family protein [Spirochaetota bacterium]
MGTRIDSLEVVRVSDGDTIVVKLNGEDESLRLTCVDTEESWATGGKPVTKAGKLASEMAKAYFPVGSTVDIEFDTDDSVDVCLTKHRGNYGRLLVYVHKGGENYSLKLVREGWSPYFVKYGRSRVYDNEMRAAEAEAQAKALIVWNPDTNAGGPSRDYRVLVPWWHYRMSAVDMHRLDGSPGLSVRLDYPRIKEAARNGETVRVLCDLQGGYRQATSTGAVVYAGSPAQKFNLWIPDTHTPEGEQILELVRRRYAGEGGRGYVYATGAASLYGEIPQIVLTDHAQLTEDSGA